MIKEVKKYNCKFQEICNCYDSRSIPCRSNGGIGSDFKPYCGKYREFSKLSNKKKRIPLEVKILLVEVVNKC